MPLREFRRHTLTRPIFYLAKKALPKLSDTEREALEAGDVWWDADLFSGKPDWQKLLDTKYKPLSKQEQAFLDGPVDQLCEMLNEWDINHKYKDLPPKVWKFLKEKQFFAMIISKKYGGLGFSAYAQSEIIRKIASRSIVTAVTVMVPNSLGPGELLHMFGTKEQKDDWLPRLASGDEIPSFGLTSPYAGSDAAAMRDYGVVCKGTFKGKKVTGIRLNWEKRYITLGPVSTVLGLAFKLTDPDHILGDEEDLGITLALIPTNLKGIDIGKRHVPVGQMFQNGPNWGKDVFIPLDFIIGGEKQIGKGWKMLMAALAAGRGISLPSLSASGTAFSARTAGAYSRVREQFNVPIGKFEGVQEFLGQIAANAYVVDAGRRLTCAGLDEGRKLAVISAILKAHATERLRDSIIDNMDIHAGKGIIGGPSNYLSHIYKSLPIAITVEGANILTRNLIIFGQGSIRCHPWVLKEMLALENKDKKKALKEFDIAFWGHVMHTTKTLLRTILHSWSFGFLAPAPKNVSSKVRRYYRRMNRYTSSFALLSDMAFLTLGGALKRKEMLSARLGDILSELFLLSSVLKRWHEDGQHEEDLPLVYYCMQQGFTTIEDRYIEILRNFPNRPMSWFLRLVALPLGAWHHGPSDKLISQCAEILTEPSETRERLTSNLYLGHDGGSVDLLEEAFDLVTQLKPLKDKMKKARIKDIDVAVEEKLITKTEAKSLKKLEDLVYKVITVDHFTAEELKTGSLE